MVQGWHRWSVAGALLGVITLLPLGARAQTGTAQSSAAQGSAVFAGTVLSDSTERPIANAEISIAALGLTVRSDSAGNFVLARIPAGLHAITVRAVGFSQLTTRMAFTDAQRIESDLLLRPNAQSLAQVDVKAATVVPGYPQLMEFEERRKFGVGRFLAQEVFTRAEGRRLSDVLTGRLPGVNAISYGGRRALASGRGTISIEKMPNGDSLDRQVGAAPKCYVQVIVDGIVRYIGRRDESLLDIDTIDPAHIAAIEYYTTSQLPPQFNTAGNAPCGTLVIWTKH